MPSRNVEKIYAENNFYHVYNRGVNKRRIFMDEEDYVMFLSILKRYLSETAKDPKGREYTSLRDKVELVSFCLMPNHFHLLLYLRDPDGITQLLRNVTTTYVMYFNRKHKRVGHLFQERFKASLVDSDRYLMHITRYIHLNPISYRTWSFSSYPYYNTSKRADWVHPEKVLELFDSQDDYASFIDDYRANQDIFDEIKDMLAGY